MDNIKKFYPKSYKIGHPNPTLYRNAYTMLNGAWDFYMDFNSKFDRFGLDKIKDDFLTITVPFDYLSFKSGIKNKKPCKKLIYHKTIEINKDINKTYILHFEGVDYYSYLFINGYPVSNRMGFNVSHDYDITDYLKDGINDIVLKTVDDYSPLKSRGKQRFLNRNYLCWYEDTRGIYKDVWLEEMPKSYIHDVIIEPSYKGKNISITVNSTAIMNDLDILIEYMGNIIYEGIGINPKSLSYKKTISIISEFHPWEVLDPKLYDIKIRLHSKYGVDEVLTYAGVRNIRTDEKCIYLNDKELYLKGILDQGFSHLSHYARTNLDMEEDIKNIISLGLNHTRMHQKIENRLYYSLCDMYGLLTTLEMPSAYILTKRAYDVFKKEWTQVVRNHINHPSIIMEIPFNESWGIFSLDKGSKKMIERCKELYTITKRIDGSRLVISNDGWSHTYTDVISIHLYNQDALGLKSDIENAISKNRINFQKGRKTVIKGFDFNKPIILSEFGGTSFNKYDKSGWGYGKEAETTNEFYKTMEGLFNTVYEMDYIKGFCYTQLYDCEQERNGLYSRYKMLKFNKEELKRIIDGKK